MPDSQPAHEPFSPEWWSALRRTADRVLAALESASADPAFRRDLAVILGAAHGLSGQISPSATVAPPVEREASPTDPPADPAPQPAFPPAARPAATLPVAVPQPALLLGPRVVAPPPAYPTRWTAEPFDPARVTLRCRVKARAARWQSERRQLLDSGQDVVEQDRQIVEHAREQGIFLWMVSPTKWRERTDEAFEVVAGCYDALADAAELMGQADRLRIPAEQEQAMRLLAEAQSALRVAVEDYGSTGRDDDQQATFSWLRSQTFERGVYVQFMQMEHPADPHNHTDLRRRVAEVVSRLRQRDTRDGRLDSLVKKLTYHARKLQQQPGEPAIEPGDEELRRVAEAAAAALDAGVPPSDTRLREALLPVADRLPGELPDALSRVMEAIDEYRDHLSEAEADASAETQHEDELVAAARQIVQGRDGILLGGVPSEPHRRKLEAGLGLRSLNWLRVEHHESFDKAEAAIRRPGVGIVLIMTRWRSHQHGPAARSVCRELEIPLVELPGGYNIRQTANQILTQVGRRAAV